jgi:integrase
MVTPVAAARHERKIVPRRRFQTGCVKKVGPSWVLYYWLDVVEDGVIRRKKRSARLGKLKDTSAAEAKANAQLILEEANKGRVVNLDVSLRDFIPEWRRVVAPTLTPSTVEGIESSIRYWLLPNLGDIALQQVDARLVQNLISKMEGRAKKTKLNIVSDLKGILDVARSPQWGHRVPVLRWEDLFIAGPESDEARSFSPEEMRAIIAAFKARKPWELFFTLLALSALRASEILGLRVQDIDYAHSLIHIRQTAWRGQVRIGTKTKASRNSVVLPSEVRRLLTEHKATDLLFPNRRGHPFSSSKVNERVLGPVLKQLGISGSLKAFRHGLSSLLVDITNPAVAQRQLRHSDAATTLGIYSHVIGDAHFQAVEAAQSVLCGTQIPIGKS